MRSRTAHVAFNPNGSKERDIVIKEETFAFWKLWATYACDGRCLKMRMDETGLFWQAIDDGLRMIVSQ